MESGTLRVLEDYFYRQDTHVSSQILLQLFSFCYAIPQLHAYLEENFSSILKQLSPVDEGIFEMRFSKIPKDLSRFVGSPLYSDISFRFPNLDDSSEQVELYGHKVLLSSNCTYFAGMFNTSMKESKQLVVEISDIPPTVFLEVIRFLYGGSVHLTTENCIDILQVSDIFGLDDLKLLCELFVGNRVDIENKEELLMISNLYNAPRLMHNCKRLQFLVSH